jgi:hypothetical protein
MSEETFVIEVSARDHRTVKIDYPDGGIAQAFVLNAVGTNATMFYVDIPDKTYRAAYSKPDIRAKIARTALGFVLRDSIKLSSDGRLKVTEHSNVVERRIISRLTE